MSDKFKDADQIFWIDIEFHSNIIHKVFDDGKYCSLENHNFHEHDAGPKYLTEDVKKSMDEAIDYAIERLKLMKDGTTDDFEIIANG